MDEKLEMSNKIVHIKAIGIIKSSFTPLAFAKSDCLRLLCGIQRDEIVKFVLHLRIRQTTFARPAESRIDQALMDAPHLEINIT